MTKSKGRNFLLLCLIVLGGFTLFDLSQDRKKEEQKTQDSRLMTLNYEQVDYIEIQRESEKIIMQRSADGWSLLQPLQEPADNTAAEDFHKNIFTERVIEVAKEGSDVDWALYGLNPPVGSILLKTAEGKQDLFEISSKTNFEDNIFIRRNKEDKVLVANSIWRARVDKKVLEFRDRRVLKHKIASVDKVRVKNESGTLEIQRVDGQWSSSKSGDVSLDQNRVREFLTVIADAKGADLIADAKKIPPLKQLLSLDLQMGEEKWSAQVGQAKDLLIYANVKGEKNILKLEPGALDKVVRMKLENLRAPTEASDTLKKDN